MWGQPLDGEARSSLDVGFGGAILPNRHGAAPVWGPGDKIEEGWYDSVGFIKSPHPKRVEVRRRGSLGLVVNALELKESGRARHCEQWTQLVHKSCQARAAPSTGR